MSKVVFLGDSITAGFEQLEKNGIKNMGISGDKTINLIGRIIDVILERPEKLFVMIGTNDLLVKERFWQDFIDIDYEALLKALLTLIKDNLKDTDVYLLSVFPVKVEERDNEDLNQKIYQMNQYIEHCAKEFDMLYIDVNSSFQDKDGNLEESYTIDGVHLSELGYETYFNLIKKYV